MQHVVFGGVSSGLGKWVCKERGRESHRVLWVHLPGLGLALEGSGPGWLAGEQFGSACGLTRRWKSGVTHASSNF